MDYAVQDIKVSENFVQAEANARAPKTGFTQSNTIHLRSY